MAEWRLYVNQSFYEANLYDAEVSEVANPFGDYAIAKIDDTSGDKFEQYPRGTRVDFQFRERSDYPYGQNYGATYGVSEDNWVTRFTGFVVERRELDQNGADSLEVECYSFDQFLRRGTVSVKTNGKTILTALEEIIKNDTPVSWVASNVTVGDDQTLTQELRGEPVENALRTLRQKSADEDFGVNQNLEFYFYPREANPATRNISNSQWFNYDIPEIGKESVNEVTVFFNDGNESVTVDDGSDKLDLQANIGTPDPVGFSKEVTREEITNIEDARDVGEQILSERASTLTGTVSTYGLYDAQPGDVINIEIVPRGISGDFRIAEITYFWGSDTTELTIVEKKGNQDRLLTRLSDSVDRVEMRPADRDAIRNQITSTSVGVTLDITGSVDSVDIDAAVATNTFRNKLRDAWADGTSFDTPTLAVGNDGTPPTRSDTSLGNELNDYAATVTKNATSTTWEMDVSETDIREIGIFDASGNLLIRATVPESNFSGVPHPSITLTVNDDPANEYGTVSTHGQEQIAAIMQNGTPLTPRYYAYGTDSTTPSESDTALGTQVANQDLEKFLVQSADSTSEWQELEDPVTTDAIGIENGKLIHQQSLYLSEGENWSDQQGVVTVTDSETTVADMSNGEGARLGSGVNVSGDFVEYEFTNEYTIPGGSVALGVRYFADADAAVRILLDGSEVYTNSFSSSTGMLWETDIGQSVGSTYSSELAPGTHTVRVEYDTPTESNYVVDVICLYDNRKSYTFDNTVDANGYLSGPELYPSQTGAELEPVSTRRDYTSATVEGTWNDVSNSQEIWISNDNGSTWDKTQNSSSATANFGSASRDLLVRLYLSRYGSRTTATPTTGYLGQEVDIYSLFADVEAINPSDIGVASTKAIFSPSDFSGEILKEGGQLDTNSDLLTRSVFADVDTSGSIRVISSEKTSFNNS